MSSSTCQSGHTSWQKWIKAALYWLTACFRGPSAIFSLWENAEITTTHFQGLNNDLTSATASGPRSYNDPVSVISQWLLYEMNIKTGWQRSAVLNLETKATKEIDWYLLWEGGFIDVSNSQPKDEFLQITNNKLMWKRLAETAICSSLSHLTTTATIIMDKERQLILT